MERREEVSEAAIIRPMSRQSACKRTDVVEASRGRFRYPLQPMLCISLCRRKRSLH